MSAPLNLSFAGDVRVARGIFLACAGAGVAALLWSVAGDPSANGNGEAGVIAAWVAAGLFAAIAAFGLYGLRRASHAGLTIDATGITSSTGRGEVVVSWAELAAVDVRLDVNRTPPRNLVEPRAIRTRVHCRIRLAPSIENFGARPDIRLLLPVVDGAPFTRAVAVPTPVLTSGEHLPVVEEVDAALRAFGGVLYRGVLRP